MWVRKIRDAFEVEISLDALGRISTGIEEEIHPYVGKGLNEGTDTEKLELCSGVEVN